MKLEKLEIESFKRIRSLTIEANGRNVAVYGDNETGKTTIADAFFFLLTGKDSRGQADFSIKTIDKETEEVLHNLAHSVKGTFSVNGENVVIKREFVEKYTRKRGAATQEHTGHTTNFFIDSVPKSEKEYNAKIAGICPADLLGLLISPTAFSSLHWTKQRAALLEVCGDVSIESVIATDPDFSAIPALLNGKSVDDWKKITAGRRQEINKRLVEIPARIDELKKSDPELTNTNALGLVEQLKKLREQLATKNAEVASVEAGGGAASLRTRIQVEEKKMQDIKDGHERSARVVRQDIADDLATAKYTVTQNKMMAEGDARRVASINEDIQGKTAVIADLGQQWKDAQAMVFVAGLCPTCQQEIPGDQVEAARAAFNLTRSQKLEGISTKGFAFKERLATLNKELEEARQEAARHSDLAVTANNKILELQTALANIDKTTPTAEELPEYQEAKRERDAIQVELADISAGKTGILIELTSQAASIQDFITAAEADLAKIEQHHKTTDRIAELGTEEKTLAGEYAKLEGQLNVIDNFTRAKVRMLDERINSRFQIVRFKMTEEQINGGLADTCVMTVDGVPYPDLNNAARIQGGLDIIRTLSGYHNFRPPVIVDNNESVTSLPDMGDTQVISLFVSADDKNLRVVVQ